MASWASLASPGFFVSTIRSTSPDAPRTTRPKVPGSSSSVVITVTSASAEAWASIRPAIASAPSRGVSPERTSTVSDEEITSREARRAPPVPSGSG
jgi:hypothetical protein